MSKPKFVPTTLSDIDLANGAYLRIEKINNNGACRVRDMSDSGRIMNYTRSVEKAWASVRYLAGITHKTQRSLGAPEVLPA